MSGAPHRSTPISCGARARKRQYLHPDGICIICVWIKFIYNGVLKGLLDNRGAFIRLTKVIDRAAIFSFVTTRVSRPSGNSIYRLRAIGFFLSYSCVYFRPINVINCAVRSAQRTASPRIQNIGEIGYSRNNAPASPPYGFNLPFGVSCLVTPHPFLRFGHFCLRKILNGHFAIHVYDLL